MDEQMAARLRAQEAALREVVADCARARDRVLALKDATGWRGPAGEAYQRASSALEVELTTAHSLLVRALNDTVAATPAEGGTSSGVHSVG